MVDKVLRSVNVGVKFMTKFSGIRFRLTENQKKKIKEIYRDEDGDGEIGGAVC